jgi:hypothetical protein
MAPLVFFLHLLSVQHPSAVLPNVAQIAAPGSDIGNRRARRRVARFARRNGA